MSDDNKYAPLPVELQTHDAGNIPQSVVTEGNASNYEPLSESQTQSNAPDQVVSHPSAYSPNQYGLLGAGAALTGAEALNTAKIAGEKLGVFPQSLQRYADTQIGHKFNIPLEDLQREAGLPYRLETYPLIQRAIKKVSGSEAVPDAYKEVYRIGPDGRPIRSHIEITPGAPEVPPVDLSKYRRTPFQIAKHFGEFPFRSGVAGYDIGRGLSDPISVGGAADIGAGTAFAAAPWLKGKAKTMANIAGALPIVGGIIPGASAAPLRPEQVAGTAVDLATGWMSPTELGEATVQPRDEPYYPGMHVLQGSRLPPKGYADGGQPEPQIGTAQAYEPSYSEKIRDYAAKYMSPQQADTLFGGPRATTADRLNPIGMVLQTPGAIADAATGFVEKSKQGNYLGAMGNYLEGAINVAPMMGTAERVGKAAVEHLGPKAADMAENYLTKIGGIQYAVPKSSAKMSPGMDLGNVLPSSTFKSSPEQTVTDPLRNAFPGIYKRPDVIASEAAARVAPENDAMRRLFGVSRDDLYQMGKGRVGNISGVLPGAATNPKGSKAAMNVMNPANEQRLLDVLSESEKHPELVKGMDPWYIMDPAYQRLEQLVGPEEAVKKYRQLNTLTGMASPGSDVLTEMNRGTAANYLATQGRFGDFVDYAGLPFGARGAGFPEDLRAVMGHPYHKTAQAMPMQKYLESGQVQMSSPKVPMYIDASGVPQTGFQTNMPVGDAHWSRAVGLADTRGAATRKGKSVVPGASVSNPEMSQLGPWWQDKIASQVGLESVPAQARAWGAFSPQTGVESPIGAPKLELLSMKIMEAANRLGITPEQARDMILTGKAYAGKKEGGAI